MASDFSATDESADDQPSARKVKLLCSFGGKILPRPTDGAFRYAGGQTRIISVRRNITLPDLCRKMSDVYGSPAAIRYQLPDEDLDALVSVSSAEDLENMMEEFDKLAEACCNGSAKLRVFLFSQAGSFSAEAVNCGSTTSGNNEVSSSSPAVVSPIAAHQVNYIPMPSFSMPAQVGSVRPVEGKAAPFSEEDQLSGRFVRPKVFQQPLSQIPPLQPSLLPPPSVEPYGFHLVPPLAQGAVLRYENCQMCQKALPHVHSDRLLNELGNVSGVHVPNDHSIVHSYHSEDTTRLQGQHNVNPGQCGTYGANKVFESVLDRDQIFGPNPEKNDLSKMMQTQASYGLFASSPKSHLDGYLQQLQKQVLHEDNFHAANVVHPTAACTLPSSVYSFNDASIGPRTCHDDFSQQHNALPAESSDYIRVFHPSGTVGLSSTGQTSYGMFVNPLQPYHDESLQQQQWVAGTAPPFFPAKQAVIGKQCSKDSSSFSNMSYNVLEPLSNPQGYVKKVDGITEALNVSTFDILKPTLSPNVGVSKDIKPENLSAVGDNNLFRLQNGANALLSSNAFITSAVDPEGIYMKPVNPVVLSTGLSREIRPESSSVVGEDKNTLRSYHGGTNLPSSDAFISSGLLPKENSMGPINTLLSSMMEVHTSELANTFQASTMAGSRMFNTQMVNPLPASQQIPGMSPYINDYSYTNTIAEGTSRLWKDEVSQNQNLFDDMAASQRTNAPFPFSGSIVPGQGGQFQEIFDPGSLLDNGGPQEILRSMAAYRPKPAIVATREPSISGDVSYENHLPKVQSPDIAVLLEEGALYSPVDWLIKESCPDPVAGTKDSGADYIDQDLRDLAEQVGELVLQSSPPAPVPPFGEPTEMNPPFLCFHTPGENCLSKGQSADIAVLLEEGALQSPVEWLIKESCPDPIVGTKDYGSDCTDQDMHDLAEQVVESVLQSSIPPLTVLSFSGPKEISPPFLRGSGLSEDNSNSQSAVMLGDQRLEDNKPRQSNKLHMGLLKANDIGRLQIIKNNDLEELRELGSGTFGTVYHGKWRGSDVAIKRINDRCFAGKPSEQEKMTIDFWNEANKLADLHHPNVVTFYGVVTDGPGGSFATVTEYMVNGSLRNALQMNDKPLDRWKCLLIAMDVAFGMEYLHGKNIIHFDLKSDNLLVNLRDPQRPICKVGDLGLSKVKYKTFISGGVRGTLPWMAPELLNDSSNLVSEKVDVFSFGIVMWELLTGEEPYSDLHYGAIIGGIVSNTLRPVVPDSCDPEWGALMEQCWSVEPTDRPSFTEIANRLRSMSASLPQ